MRGSQESEVEEDRVFHELSEEPMSERYRSIEERHDERWKNEEDDRRRDRRVQGGGTREESESGRDDRMTRLRGELGIDLLLRSS